MNKLKSEIIKLLTENARYSFSQIATILGEKEDVVSNAVKELENDGAIIKYSAIINHEVIDPAKVQALIEVKVAPQKLNGFDSYARELYIFPEVQSLYLMSGGFDLAVFVEGDNLASLARFVAEKLSIIDGITSVQTHFILKKYKVEGQVTDKNDGFERQMIQA